MHIYIYRYIMYVNACICHFHFLVIGPTSDLKHLWHGHVQTLTLCYLCWCVAGG